MESQMGTTEMGHGGDDWQNHIKQMYKTLNSSNILQSYCTVLLTFWF
jgi:hypothetical protein